MLRSMFRKFGVALMAALSLMAVGAVSAQGATLSNGGTAGNFTVLGLTTLVTGTAITGTILHGILLIPSKNAYILCESGDIVEAKGLSASEVLAVVRFLKCGAYNDTTKAILGACPIEGENALGEKGTIDASFLGIAKLHEGKSFVLFVGHGAEQVFATIKFGPECGIGVKVKKSGSEVAEVDNGESKVDHLLTFSEAIQKLFQVAGVGDRLLYGSAEAFLVGVGHLSTSGQHLSCTWAVV